MLRRITQEIALRGHEVALHSHNGPHLPDYQQPLFRLTRAEQIRILAIGKERLETWTGQPVTSFRAGGYAINDATFEALEELGILVDSSVLFGAPANRIRPFTVNAACQHGALLEVPVTRVARAAADGSGRTRARPRLGVPSGTWPAEV